MRRVDPLLFGFLIAFLGVAALAYLLPRIPATTDMVDQPSLKPQERPFLPPPHAVPIHGRERQMDILEAAETLQNPVDATPASIEQGKWFFEIYCLVCHGPHARGDGPIARKLENPPDDLTQESTIEQTDGYLYTVIREGGAGMPAQAEGLLPRERWDIVNYLRSLQREARPS
ncbi:MAG: c-type cytochrome [Candidatus Methylomirabilales bacterium]